MLRIRSDPAAVSRFLLLILLWFHAALAGAAAVLPPIDADHPARDLASCLEYHEDAAGMLDLNRVLAGQARFLPYAGHGRPNFGYSDSTWWLRCQLRQDQADARLLEVGYPTLDRVELFVPDAAGSYVQLHSGDRWKFSERLYPHRHLVFPIELPAGEPVIYLRVRSEGSLTLPLTLWQPEAFQRQAPRDYARMALYFGMLLALAAYNFLLYLVLRDRSYMEYVLFALGMAVGLASVNGLAQQFLWPEWPGWGHVAFPLGFSVAGLFGAMFTRSFLATARTAPRLDRLLRVLVGLFALSMLLHLVSYQWGAMTVSLAGFTVAGVSLAAGLQAWRRGHPGARFFLLAWTVLLAGVAVTALRNFGWLPTNLVTQHAMQIGSILDMLLLSFALADRINSTRAEKEAAQAGMLEAKQTMLDALRRSEEALEGRVAQRTQELATANAQLRENEQTLSRLARQDALTGLGNRIALEEEMRKAIGRAGRLGTGVVVMLIDLDRFKPVNDQLGHGVGDLVLRQVAERLCQGVRKSDTVARLGGDEFIVLLEGYNVMADAPTVADKLLRALAEPFLVQDQAIGIGASIGFAALGLDDTPGQLLRRADQAMYVAKRQGGNRYASGLA